MFEDILRELQKLERGMKVTVNLPADEKVYLDRQCPSDNCKAVFKIKEADWETKKAPGQKLVCPICRHEAPPDDWATAAQTEYAKKVALGKFKKSLDRAFESGTRRFNSRPQRGFITLSLSYKPDVRPVRLPRATAEVMEQHFTCEKCSCQYASIGAAFFCPLCGHNSALTTFEQAIATVQNTTSAATEIRKSFAGANGRDAAHDAVRMILEQSLCRLVGAFERFSEALFVTVPGAGLLILSGRAADGRHARTVPLPFS